METKKIPNAAALHIIEESILSGSSVRLTVRGNSMAPLLLDGKDVVTLRPFDPAELKPGVIILFRYKGGFVLHRIIGIAQSSIDPLTIITARGDALTTTETITFADIIAVAVVPRHIFPKKVYRQMVIFFSRVRRRLNR